MPPGRPPFRRELPISKDEHRINDRIRVPRVKVVDENGVMLGEMPTLQALQIARELGYDLVEVAAESCNGGDNAHLCLLQVAAEKEAEALVEQLKSRINVSSIPIYELPPAIVVHAGPKAMGLGFFI